MARVPQYRVPKPRSPTVFAQPLEKLLNTPTHEEPPYGSPPDDWTGSVAEWAIAWALTTKNVEFVYQANMIGGRTQLGGTVADFLVPAYNLIIRVMGVYFHYERGPLVVNLDQLLKASLEAKGYVVIDIDDDDALRDPLYFVTEALAGRDHSRATEGV